MEQIANSMNSEEWAKMKMTARVLKGASGYVGAGKIHYACYYIQESYNSNDF